MSPQSRPKLTYLVTADWYFALHHLPLACAAKNAGYDVTVATHVKAHGDVIRDAGLKLVHIPFTRSGIHPITEARAIAQIASLYRRVQPDIVHHLALKPIIYGAAGVRFSRVKNVVNGLMGLGYVFTSRTAKARLLRPGVRAALKRALGHQGSLTIVQNRDDFTELTLAKLADPSKIRVVRGAGATLASFTPQPLPDGPPVVVLPARLLRDKGVIEFAEAAQRLKSEGLGARFVLAGEIDPSNPASLTARELDNIIADGSVEHWGWRTDMPAVYAESTIVCLPTYREGLPTVLLEAAASGRAIVTTDVQGCREIVTGGRNGWLVSPRSVPALTNALREALNNKSMREAYVRAAFIDVSQNFRPEDAIQKVLTIYEELQSQTL